MNVIVCFPRQQESLVSMYASNRNLDDLTMLTSLEDAEKFLDKLKPLKTDKVSLYLFDFINEAGFYQVFRRNIHKFGELQVVTTQLDIVNTYLEFTNAIYFVRPMMDLLSFFWDSEVFHINNITRLARAGEPPITRPNFNVRGMDIQTLDLRFNVAPVKVLGKGTAKHIELTGKAKGTQNKKESQVRDSINKSANKLLEKARTAFDIEVPENVLENKKFSATIQNLNTYYPKSINEVLMRKGKIKQAQSDELSELRAKSVLRGTLGELNYAFSKGWINEPEYMEIMSEYYKISGLSEQEVWDQAIVLNEFRIEACLKNNCFPVQGIRSDVTYFVIDYDNRMAREQIGQRFNNYEFIYARDAVIRDRLKALAEEKGVNVNV